MNDHAVTNAPGALLAPDEPAPARIVNGDAGGRVLLVCDHASNAVPRALGDLGLDHTELARHIGWDIGAAAVTEHLAGLLDAPAVLAAYSRLVIDCNRAPEDPTLIMEISDGTVVPGNRRLDDAARRRRLDALFRPYHRAVDAELARLAAAMAPGTAPVVLSIHSFTPVMAGVARPWHYGILWTDDARLPVPLIDRLARDPDIVVGDNKPYSARAGYGYTLEAHAAPKRLAGALIELRQDLIDTAAGARRWAAHLGAALTDVLADPALFRAAAAPARRSADDG